MKLGNLLKDVTTINSNFDKDINVFSISINTKKTQSGSLFICLKGENFDGHNLKQIAQQNGAVAFVVEEYDNNFNGIQIVVKSTRAALSQIAKNFYNPNKRLKVIGITGTNGKTTTTYIIANILKCAGKKVGIIGTQGVSFNGITIKNNMTTPDPIDLFRYLSLMSKEKVEYVVMEVSAHAIYYNKIDAIDFYAKGLTNITEDHLDFFKTISEYSKQKINYIMQGKCKKVVNIAQEYGVKIALSNKKVITYKMKQPADIFCSETNNDFSTYCLNVMGNNICFKTKLIGKYNVENAMLAAGITKTIGIDNQHIEQGIETFCGVEGRMNIYKNGNKTVIIDFAHTPDAIENVLKTISEFKPNKLISIFGCGGNRDPQKRKLMGNIASKFSDMVYITNDNPRMENPNHIAKDIASGIKKENFQIILERGLAIKTAIQKMQDGDIVALLGKGAEDYMEIGETKHPYSDKSEVQKWGFKEWST